MMDESKLLQKLISVSHTKIDLNRRLRVLREFLEQKYYSGGTGDLDTFLKSANCSADDAKALSSLDRDFYKSFTKNNTYPVLNKITKLVNKEEVLHVYVPYEMSEQEKEKLGSWFKENVNGNLILEIHLDPALTLGCAFAFKGVYHNYSLKYFINNNRREIAKLMDRYEKNP